MFNPSTEYQLSHFSDSRGTISFSNSFDLSYFKRFYYISPTHASQIRAWQGHQYESKAFFPLNGRIKLVLISVLDFDTMLFGDVSEFELNAQNPRIISIPGGFLNGFQFLEENSKLMVFSSFTLEESKNDDFRFDQNCFYDWK